MTQQEAYASFVQNGDQLFNNAQYANAKTEYISAISSSKQIELFNPPLAEVWYKIGTCEYNLADYDNAVESYDQALRFYPVPVLKNKILFAKGESLIYLKRNPEAKLAFILTGLSDTEADRKIAELYAAHNRPITTTPAPVTTSPIVSQTLTPVTGVTNPVSPELTINSGNGTAGAQNPIKTGPTDSGYIIPGILAIVIIAIITTSGIILHRKMYRRIDSAPKKENLYSEETSRKPVSQTIPHDVFISYASQEKAIADAVCAALEAKKIRCWIAPRDILPGANYQEALVNAIDSSRIMVLIFSSHSDKSPHVIRELTRAMSKNVMIIPFRVEDVQPSKTMEFIISIPHWLDAITPPLERHIDTLIVTIQKNLELS